MPNPEEATLGDILHSILHPEVRKPSKFDKIEELTIKAIGRITNHSRIDAVIVIRAMVECSLSEAMAFADTCKLFVDNMERHRREELNKLREF